MSLKSRLLVGWLLLGMVSFVFPSLAQSQDYERSAGVRLGSTSALTFKRFLGEEQAIEFLLSGRDHGVQLTSLYIKHHQMSLGTFENFYFYAGVGGHAGYQKNSDITKVRDPQDSEFYYYKEDEFVELGIDGLVGIEWRIFSIPLSISVDIMPHLTYVGFAKVNGDFWDGSLGIKYIF
ncbi:hypothetical protein [Reichenbachiella sp. MSK19-1]|uniref:hypothetical protein n=1 Tax=Reichenbachiella sp. MSK19-1 TaxID=1897631 RepID=UPI0011C3C729|nr:hypothetical protein [Reichenbachiella sp. MSK19-1]